MKKKNRSYLIIGFSFLAISILSFNSKFVSASDDDDDGIDDDFEDLNKRNIEFEINDDEIQIESRRRSGDKIDDIQLKIQFDSEGLSFDLSYEEEYNSGTEFDLEFGVEFQEIIEYRDINNDGVYDSEVDSVVQTIFLDQFYPVNYSLTQISGETNLHYFRIETKDGIFKAHIYFIEEFSLVNNSLITPNQIKLNIEIVNFQYLDSNSKLALYTKLVSEDEFEEEHETEDEESGFAENEHGVTTTINQYTGIFTWDENATIDGVSQEVLVSTIEIDENDEDEQKIYLNYLRGTQIFHDPKIGIKGLLITKIGYLFPIVPIIIIISVLTALSMSVAYSIYYYSQHKPSNISWDNNKKHLKFLKRVDLQLFAEEDSIKKLIGLGNVNITAISEDLVEIIDNLNMEVDEKEEFLLEMLSLTPKERSLILNKLLKS